MDFTLDADQDAILGSVTTLLGRHAGPGRLTELGGDEPAYDHELDKRLHSAGFLDVVERGATNRLNGALVAEAIAGALGSVASASRLLVAPSLPSVSEGPIAIVTDRNHGPIRFVADAESLVVIGSGRTRLVSLGDTAVSRIRSRLGWPVGELPRIPDGLTIDGVDPEEIRTWARVAVAVEMAGTMRYALDMAVRHVTDRTQFGRPIGSFQAVQHGLAECAVAIDGARWLAREAAWSPAPARAAMAAVQAIEASKIVFARTHQYCGAIGFSQEYDLHLATMRLPALRAELESLGRPTAASVRHLWDIDSGRER